jgi:hypothetical protein
LVAAFVHAYLFTWAAGSISMLPQHAASHSHARIVPWKEGSTVDQKICRTLLVLPLGDTVVVFWSWVVWHLSCTPLESAGFGIGKGHILCQSDTWEISQIIGETLDGVTADLWQE